MLRFLRVLFECVFVCLVLCVSLIFVFLWMCVCVCVFICVVVVRCSGIVSGCLFFIWRGCFWFCVLFVSVVGGVFDV